MADDYIIVITLLDTIYVEVYIAYMYERTYFPVT